MLPRSNSSNAADRLRRAKSNSSAHTTSSGHHRTPTSADPFVTRQHAEAAAAEAYLRARQNEETTLQSGRPVPPKLHRRRSQAAGKTEGSHFEGARLGLRRSLSTKEEKSAAMTVQQRRQLHTTEALSTGDETDKLVTRKRAVIPPSAHQRLSQYDQLTLPPTTRHLRKSQSGYTDGSPTSRNVSSLKERSSTLQLRTPLQEDTIDGYGGNLAQLSDFASSSGGIAASAGPSIRAAQTDEGILMMARDRYLQDFQQRKVRERKSFILAPFQKRKTTIVQNSGPESYDTSLPPFNHASDTLMAPLPPAPDPEVTAMMPGLRTERKTRNFSDTLKGRFRKVFRRASKAPGEFPAQQVQGSHFHFAGFEGIHPSPDTSIKEADPFMALTSVAPATSAEPKSNSANSRQSASASSTVKSRVTSWTNSTIAGTWSTRADNDMPAADEQGGLKRSDSMATLRKASSFFGRPVRNKLRRASKVDLQGSEESQGLYSALQERILPSTELDTPEKLEFDEPVSYRQVSSALSTLPSQQRPSSTTSNRSSNQTPTIRTVTPDLTSLRLGPITEIMSPEPTLPGSSASDVDTDKTDASKLLRRRPAVKAAPPSQDQIARRVEKTRNRWQAPLDELSPSAPGWRKAIAMDEDNPYELRSLSTSVQPVFMTDLPHHAKVSREYDAVKKEMFSPSIYSRATDGASPRPDTPVDHGGVVVTITGREVRRYSISPQKTEPPVEQHRKPSKEWRRWLSDEFSGFREKDGDLSLAHAFAQDVEPESSNSSNGASTAVKTDSRPNSKSPTPAETMSASTRPARPRASSRRRSSFMNDRYPMLDNSLNSSGHSIQTRKMSSAAGDSSASARPSLDAQSIRPDGNQQRAVTTRRSIAFLESAGRSRSALDSGGAQGMSIPASKPTITDAQTMEPTPLVSAPSSRARSAFDLRAKYRNSQHTSARPLEVRRRFNDNPPTSTTSTNAIHNNSSNSYNHNNNNISIASTTDTMTLLGIEQDPTLQDIAAGPYSLHSQAEKEKENTTPLEAHALPALSSSEWLAAGPKVRRLVPPRDVHPAFRVRRGSPGIGGGGRENGGGNEGSSPAQRMVTEFLERRSREGTPGGGAFV